jgi:hypothetical protein
MRKACGSVNSVKQVDDAAPCDWPIPSFPLDKITPMGVKIWRLRKRLLDVSE